MIAITGIGVITALGDAEDTFAGLCAGQTGIQGLGPFPGRGPVAAIPGGPHLSTDLAFQAVQQALGVNPPPRFGLVGATTSGDMVRGEAEYEHCYRGGEPRSGFLWAQLCDRPTQRLAHMLKSSGPRLTVSTACSSGAVAAGVGADWIRRGRCSAAVVFGTDALCQMTVHGFGALGAVSPVPCRPFDAGHSGLSLGEGAGAILLEDAQAAERRGTPILGFLTGVGVASDAHHMTAPHPDGRGAEAAVRAALHQAGDPSIDWVCAHGTGTRLNDLMEAGVLGRLLPDVPVSSVKGAIGHTLGAAGTIELVMAVLATQRGVLPPNVGLISPGFVLDLIGEVRHQRCTTALSVNFAFGGNNAAVVVRSC